MERKKFLFLGNSHTYFNDMPHLFQRMCREGGFCEAEVSMIAIPYASYEWHLGMETELRFALLYGHYDYLIMQQAAHSPCPSMEETLRDGAMIIRQARANQTVPIQVWPWAEKRKPEHQKEIDEIYRELARREGVTLIPTGKLFEAAREREEIPDLYWKDGEHGSPWGSYGAAAMLYSCLSGRTPMELMEESLSYAKADKLPARELWQTEPYPLEASSCLALKRLVMEIRGLYYDGTPFRN